MRRGGRHTWGLGAAAAAGVLVAAPPCGALINPDYTVADLVRDSAQVWVLRAAAPRDGAVSATVAEVLAGAAPAGEVGPLAFDFSEAEDLGEDRVVTAFGGASEAMGVLFVRKRKEEGRVVGALQIGTAWMGTAQNDGGDGWRLDRDPNDLETVWAGSAHQLVAAVRYVLSDPAASFPVASAMEWGKDRKLGTLAGAASGCRVLADGVFVLSAGGDRVYRVATGDEAPVDATAALGLTSRSKRIAAGDVDGDGRCDLVSWDGAAVSVLARREDGTLGSPARVAPLGDCLSLDVLDGGLVAGAADGVVVLRPQTGGAFAERRLPGPGGPCVVADVDGDGACDLVQVSADAVSVRRGTVGADAFADPLVTRVSSVRRPVAVLCGDYDADGQLDLMVSGDGGAALLSRAGTGPWRSVIAETGELGAASGLGQGEAHGVGAVLCDLNGDGRQSVAFFHADAAPGLFFNRGFACFGVARSLAFPDLTQPAAIALGSGQQAGTVCDLNGDRVPDLLAVDRQGGAWVMYGEDENGTRRLLTVALADGARRPLTVSVQVGGRHVGMWVVRPGEPVGLGVQRAGKAVLTWRSAGGEETRREVMVMASARVTL